jgi:hypothetical protein
MRTSEYIWQKFVSLPGAVVDNQVGIASEHAIGGVIQVIRKYLPRRILELGAGIGTLTYTVLETLKSFKYFSNGDYVFFTVENNEFCLQQLSSNLAGFNGLFKVISSTNIIPRELQFDLIIVDGGGELDGDMGVMNFRSMMAHKGVILIEGNRSFQSKLILDWYGNREHLYAKVRAARPQIKVKSGSLIVTNKPYQTFVFEPEWQDKVFWQLQSLLSNVMNRFVSKMDWMKAKKELENDFKDKE